MLYAREWAEASKVCPKCGFHARLTISDRVALLLDANSWQELDPDLRPTDPLGFAPAGRPSYAEKLATESLDSGQSEAAAYGRGTLDGLPVSLAILDMGYFAGTLGSVVGEKIARAFELGIAERRAVIVVSASGGARQQEGVVALIQMAKTAAAVQALGAARLPFISILTDPTLGGVTASFEFQLRHGMVDQVVARRDQKAIIARLIRLFSHATQPAQDPTASASTPHGEPRVVATAGVQ
ncbi:MAG: acetyl-CoA carboxylase carboxyl transferase subunit beta [Chloroflexi bacterium]|nr:acetyl-CoA carboxylase carboxyl transferase subunit beta [Chloroflexota bacterium]